MNIVKKTILGVAPVMIIAGAILCFWFFSKSENGNSGSAKGTNNVATVTNPPPIVTNSIKKIRPPRPNVSTNKSSKLPDAFVNLLIKDSVNNDSYKNLKTLLRSLDKIADPEVRLELLDALSWYDETAVEDAIPFLLDPSRKVAARAATIVEQNLESISKPALRRQLYTLAITRMADEADQDQMVAMLEGERKSYVLDVLGDLEPIKDSKPQLWKKLTDEYKEIFHRRWAGRTDALLHWHPDSD